NQVVATYELAGSGPGSAAVLVHRNGTLELEMRGLGAPSEGRLYEAWIIPAGKQPVAAGTMVVGDGRITLPSGARGTTVAVTIEFPPGAQAPTTTPIFAGPVGS